MDVLLAFDQSTTHVGWVLFEDGKPTKWGSFAPDPPYYDEVRAFVRQCAAHYYKFGITLSVAVETTYLGKFKDRQGNIRYNPQVFIVLTQIRAHLCASARDMGLNYIEVTPFKAMHALTGINDIHTRSKERKAAMVAAAQQLLHEAIDEHISDALGVGLAALQPQLSPPDTH